MGANRRGVVDFTAQHMNHCNQGEYVGSCKYGEDATCPTFRTSRGPVITAEEFDTLDLAEMMEGYLDGGYGDEEPGDNRSKAYWHGWRNGHNDRAGVVDQAQRDLIRDLHAKGRKFPFKPGSTT